MNFGKGKQVRGDSRATKIFLLRELRDYFGISERQARELGRRYDLRSVSSVLDMLGELFRRRGL